MNYNAKRDQLNNKLQDITDRLESLEIYYKRETKYLKSELKKLSTDLRELEESGFETPDEFEQPKEIKAEVVVPVAQAVTQENRRKLLKFEKGFVASISNTYKGEYGTVGIVKKITPDFVTITDASGKEHTRAPKNLDILAQDAVEYNEWRRSQGLRAVHFKSRKGKERKNKKFWA